MKTDLTELTKVAICPKCGSADYLEDYPTLGKRTCGDCGHEIADITLKPVLGFNGIPKSCPSCGPSSKRKDIAYDFDEYVQVLKCQQCGKLEGYKIINIYDTTHQVYDKQHSGLTVKIAENEGKPILSTQVNRKIAAALKKSVNSPKGKCQMWLTTMIKQMSKTLERIKIDALILSRATNQARREIQRNGPLTEKQLQILYPAALLEAQETLLILGEVASKAATERQLEKIFNVDRKTLRKWKKRLLNEKPKSVLSHQIDSGDVQRNQKGNSAIY
jgi:Zn ribbon nucleic-acid-binding protein